MDYFWFSVFIALQALLLFALAMRVSLLRMKFKISTGDGGNDILFAAIRAQGNAIEQVPIFAFLLLALTLNQLPNMYLSALVTAFTLARVAHAMGMNHQAFIARRLGAGLTYLLQLVAVFMLCWQIFY
ncbi:MAPEG family protein [Marinagarivorans algicola]|uniref:MAPEG family protein n=1 Tax=Marinagarivorans algicola TaxID=1513270 RepID=UPI0006B44137|nr:MAPEG family protein [Marinagarivorans algicola]